MVSELTLEAELDAARDDVCIPFLINGGAFRGRVVRLTAATTEILRRHGDPDPVGALLAEALVAAAALAAGLKFEGVFTLQIQSDGPVHMLVADVTTDGRLRGCAKFDAIRLEAELGRARPAGLGPHLLGGGHLAFTVDQGPDTERYQGIVELSGGGLADSIHHYFRQSEQLDSALKIATGHTGPDGVYTAAALLIQRMPQEGGVAPADILEDPDEAWRTAVILLGSVKDTELIDPALTPVNLLARLYGTVGVRALRPRHLRARCRCSRVRSGNILASFPIAEIESLSNAGAVQMTCEFCREVYDFSVDEIEKIAAIAATDSTSLPQP